MFLKLEKDYSKYQYDDLILFIFPSVPYWFSATKQFESIFDKLKKGTDFSNDFNNFDSDTILLFEKLIYMGIISKDGKRETSIEIITPKGHIWGVHDICEIELTLKCNLECSHCYIFSDSTYNLEDAIDIKDISNLIHDLSNIKTNESRIVLTGGEPFLRKDLLKIIELIYDNGFTVLINTNSLPIKKSQIERLKKYNNLQICISLDGLKENHEFIRGKGTYEKTIQKIKEIKQSGIKTTINSLCHKDNIDDLSELFKFVKDFNLDGINPVPVVLMGRTLNNRIIPVPEKEFYKQVFEILKSDPIYKSFLSRTSFINLVAGLALNIKSKYCGTGTRGTFYVSHLGEVFPCPNMRYNEFNLGNIKNNSLLNIIKKNPILEKLKLLNVETINEKCSTCDVRYFCGGFCRGETYGLTKDICSPYIRCKEFKEGILECLVILSKNPEFFDEKIQNFYLNAKSKDPSYSLLNCSRTDLI